MAMADDTGFIRSRRVARASVAIALLAIAIVPLLPVILSRGYPTHSDLYRYEVLTSLFADAIANGRWYPRWMPDLLGARGYPTFVFYQPLIFYAAALARAAGGPVVSLANSTYVAQYFFTLAGALGAYRLARPWLAGDRVSAVTVALLFVLTPYAFTDLHVRGDHSEYAAMMLTPWTIVALRAVERRILASATPRVVWPVVGGAFAWAGVVYGHPATAIVYAPAILAFAVVRWRAFDDAARRRRWAVAFVGCAALAALIASPYWFVVLQCRPFVALDRVIAGPFHPTHHLRGLIEMLIGHGGLPDPTRPDAGTTTPIALGVAHATLAVAGAIVAIRAGPRRAPWGVAAAAILVTLVIAMMPISAPFWRLPTPFALLQFPWRVNSVVGIVASLLAAHALGAFGERVLARRAVAAAAVAVTLAWHAHMFVPKILQTPATPDAPARPVTWAEANAYLAAEVHDLRYRNATYALAREFDPLSHTAIGAIRGDAPIVAGDHAIVREAPDSTRYRIDATIDATQATGVLLRQTFFPGWRVEVNGVAVDDDTLRANLLPDGQMVLAVPAGTSRLTADYDGPPHWRGRVAATWSAIVATLAWLARAQRRWAATSAAFPSPGTAPGP